MLAQVGWRNLAKTWGSMSSARVHDAAPARKC